MKAEKSEEVEPQEEAADSWSVKVVESGGNGELAHIIVRGKIELDVIARSGGILPVDNFFRQMVLMFVHWKWFDRFILGCIVLNSILLGIYQHRARKGEDHFWLNQFIDNQADHALWAIFTVESVLKIMAWGLICGKNTYLRDPWNILDFVVVMSGLIERLGLLPGLGVLRLFRLLRPLRSLNAVPQMKILVNTALSSILKLGNVMLLGSFLFGVFGIVGIQLMNGIFLRTCHVAEKPSLIQLGNTSMCWEWTRTGDERLCGGNYDCDGGFTKGHCGGHEEDPDKAFRPEFSGVDLSGNSVNDKGSFEWCVGSDPWERTFPETEFVNFDNLATASLLIFQSMTLEGWTDLMYMVMDAFSPWWAQLYFFMIVVLTNFFMLNVALAVVDEVQDEFRDQAKEDEEAENAKDEGAKEDEEEALGDEAPLWLDNGLVRFCNKIAESELFQNFIMLIIAFNVVNMCLTWFSLVDAFGYVVLNKAIEYLEITFLVIFVIEMCIMLIALGPKGYAMNPITAFDGFVVVISTVELVLSKMSGGGGGGLSALRTFRLFRVMNKLANKWSKLKVLLKAMVHTGLALNYWLILFMLVLYIFTLIWMQCFAQQFQFGDADSLYPLDKENIEKQEPWCAEAGGLSYRADSEAPDTPSYHLRQDCIPRAHFDTFVWGLVTVFQVMTGENWNTIMYAGMQASKRWEDTIIPKAGTFISAFLFIGMIMFGQTLFMSLFLSMLLSKFADIQEEMAEEEQLKRAQTQSLKDKEKSSARKKDQDEGEDQTDDRVIPVRPADDGDDSGAPETLPGQLPESPHLAPGAPASQQHHVGDDEGDAGLKVEAIPEKKGWLGGEWPYGYAWFVLHETNPIRKGAHWLMAKNVRVGDMSINVFDNFILVCILLSTLCMMIDTPLSPPEDDLTLVIRSLDKVFAYIFICEMVVKLVALGLAWGPDAYLKSGWNWLDGIVVMVSLVDIAGLEGPGFLRVLRILRTFRPLRMVSRFPGLKLVVQTVFTSLADLVGLVIVSLLFTLIFALIFLMFLQGNLYACDGDVSYLTRKIGDKNLFSNLGEEFATPLCLDLTTDTTSIVSSQVLGAMNPDTGLWEEGGSCPAGLTQWTRASADTPICLGRCDAALEEHKAPVNEICHRKYTKTAELPNACENPTPQNADEVIGFNYINDMMRTAVIPCGGTTVVGSDSANPAEAASCKKKFCPDDSFIPDGLKDTCKSECTQHAFFCKDTCKDFIGEDSTSDPKCQACREECEAACVCPDHCTPLILDAALCHEQGGHWAQVLSQNFDNILNSMLTLFEISTTEGWVDVMYAASDYTGPYRQPVRDSSMEIYVILFPLWILLSFMFLINLAVGIIVDNFMLLKEQGKESLMTEAQAKWVTSRKKLGAKPFIFIQLNLQNLSPFRRKIYNIVDTPYFDNGIMATIVLNTVIMGCTVFPAPTDWWKDFQSTANYVFAVIYTTEAVLKLIALRRNYFIDNWNNFDLFCVIATLSVIILTGGFDIDLGSAGSVVRILRIARLFRLLRFLKELNRLFMCLLISIPKLGNVTAVLVLFLILYSILGMSLFGTSKQYNALGDPGNFQTFFRSFVTLFRASTGEAWNEIMHSLAMEEVDFFHLAEPDWCTPQSLFKSRDKETFKLLDDKCLIDHPNACPGSWNPFPAFYWVSYTLLITFMVLNLVVAVILEGYDEGKSSEEADNIEVCVEVWKDYDPDHHMAIPLPDALTFINQVLKVLKERDEKEGKTCEAYDMPPLSGKTMGDICKHLPMRYARAFDLSVTPDGMVTFMSASKQVLRFTVLENLSDTAFKEIDACEHNMGKRELANLKSLESKSSVPAGVDFAANAAAMKLQKKFRSTHQVGAAGGASKKDGGDAEGNDLRAAGAGEAAMESGGFAPPRAG